MKKVRKIFSDIFHSVLKYKQNECYNENSNRTQSGRTVVEQNLFEFQLSQNEENNERAHEHVVRKNESDDSKYLFAHSGLFD